ncbi:hypothetical protein Tco_0355262 [Tanacetum coccineum]
MSMRSFACPRGPINRLKLFSKSLIVSLLENALVNEYLSTSILRIWNRPLVYGDVMMTRHHPPNSEPVSSKVIEIVFPELEGIEEKSSGLLESESSTITHVIFLKFDSFIFDLSIYDLFPPADRSDFIMRSSSMDLLTYISPPVQRGGGVFKKLSRLASRDLVYWCRDISLGRKVLDIVLMALAWDFVEKPRKAMKIIRQDIRRSLYGGFSFYDPGSQQEVDINKKAENQAKMTKLSMEWKRLCKNQGKSKIRQVRVTTEDSAVKTGAGTDEYY